MLHSCNLAPRNVNVEPFLMLKCLGNGHSWLCWFLPKLVEYMVVLRRLRALGVAVEYHGDRTAPALILIRVVDLIKFDTHYIPWLFGADLHFGEAGPRELPKLQWTLNGRAWDRCARKIAVLLTSLDLGQLHMVHPLILHVHVTPSLTFSLDSIIHLLLCFAESPIADHGFGITCQLLNFASFDVTNGLLEPFSLCGCRLAKPNYYVFALSDARPQPVDLSFILKLFLFIRRANIKRNVKCIQFELFLVKSRLIRHLNIAIVNESLVFVPTFIDSLSEACAWRVLPPVIL